MKTLYKGISVVVCIMSVACGISQFGEAAVTLEKEPFGKTPDGTEVMRYTLSNENGIEVEVTNYEGIVLAAMMPDHEGKKADVVLGYETLDEYIARDPYFGGIEERSSQQLNGVVWETEEFCSKDSAGLILTAEITGKDDKRVVVTVTYTLNMDNEFKVDYAATTNQETLVNLSTDTYFNLAGEEGKSVLDHELLLNAEAYYPLDETLKPIYELQPVLGTPMNYTRSTAIRPALKSQTTQVRLRSGYQHIWRVDKEEPGSLEMAARIVEPQSKRVLEVQTTTTGIYFGTGHFLEKGIVGKRQKTYQRYAGFTLSARKITTSEARVNFPAIPLLPEQAYSYTVVYKFFALGTEKE